MLSNRSHDAVTRTATRTTRMLRLANFRLYLEAAETRGEVVAAA